MPSCRHTSLFSSLLSGESYERRTVSWLQVECSPQMGQVATYSVCYFVIIQIGSTDCKHVWRTCDVSSSILAISLLPQSVHIGDNTKNWFNGSCSCSEVKKTGIWRHITEDMWRRVLYYQITWRHFTGVWRHVFYNTTTCRHSQKTYDVVYSTRHDVTSQDMWRHVFLPDYMTSPLRRRDAVYSTRHDVTSRDMWHVFYVRLHDTTLQWTCDAVYSTTHDVTVKRKCDVTCSTPDYMTSLHRRRVTLCSLLGMTSHRRACDIVCSTPTTWRHFTEDMTSHLTGQYCSVNAFLTSNLNFSSSLYVLVLNLLCFVVLIMFAMHSRKLIPCTYNTHE